MKTLSKMALAALLLFAISCTKAPVAPPQPVSATAADNAVAATTHFIGEHFGGGIVFYINGNGSHGLIADTIDLATATWYNGTYTITGVTATKIGSGKSNTRAIILDQGKTGNYAAIECAKSRRSGFSDWYLPSLDELHELYLQRDLFGNFILNYYWSSTEIHDSSVFAYGIYFYSGVEYANPKNIVGNVRAIRSF